MRIKTNRIWLFFALLPYFRPFCMAYIHNSIISILWIIFSGLYVVTYAYFIFLIVFKRKKASKISILLILLNVWMIISTALNEPANVSSNIMVCVRYSIFIYIIDANIDDMESLIDSLFLLFEISIYINLFFMILFPGGMYLTEQGAEISSYADRHTGANWIIGGKNTLIRYLLPTVCVAFIYMFYHNKKSKTFRATCLLGAIIATVLISRSGTAIGLLVIVSVLCLYTIIVGVDKTSIRIYEIAPIVLFFMIIIFRVQNIFAFFIEGILGKSITFTGRTMLWDSALIAIMQKPIIGHGYQTSQDYGRVFGGYYHPHDYYLYIIYLGGIIGLILFVTALVFGFGTLIKSKNHQLIGFIAICLFAIMVQMIFDTMIEFLFFDIVIIFAYRASDIIGTLPTGSEKKLKIPVKFVYGKK